MYHHAYYNCFDTLTQAQSESDNILIMCVDLYRIAYSTTLIIARECCEAIENHVRPLDFEKPILVGK